MERDLIEIEDLSKNYLDDTGFNVHLLEDVSFSIREGSITTLLAPTGAGKSSLMKIIAGLEKSTSGEIKDHTKNRIFIPSGPSSFPWLNVIDNIKFHLKEVDDSEIQRIINLVGLEGYEDHFPHNKSLGFRFRISLARTLAHNADLLIIDEPFIKVRNEVKLPLYSVLRNVSISENKTILFSTTNISEAVYLSDKIYLMSKNPGKVVNEFNINVEESARDNLYKSDQYFEIRKEIEEGIKKITEHQFLNFSI